MHIGAVLSLHRKQKVLCWHKLQEILSHVSAVVIPVYTDFCLSLYCAGLQINVQ